MAIKENAIRKPSDTVVVRREKEPAKGRHRHADLAALLHGPAGRGWQRRSSKIERGCHGTLRAGTVSRSGSSNFAFVDGSVRLLKYGRDVWPEHLWAISDQDRNVVFPWKP